MATFEIIGASSGGGGSPAGYAAGYPDGTKIYMALLTQSGTDAPVATVLMNTLGGTVVWTRVGIGSYEGTLANAFTENKTTIFYPPTLYDGQPAQIGRISSNVIAVSVPDDSFITGLSLQIIVYP